MDDLQALATRRLATRWAGQPLVLRAETGSTNDDVRDAAMQGAPTGYTVVADAQREGRGRRGRSWHSPAGENLYLSVLARPALAAHDAPRITLATALAVWDAVDAVVADPARVTIKWPNDVRIDGRKVAGILVEGSLRGGTVAHVVIGIGLNVRGTVLPDAIANTATTLRRATGRDVDRARVLHTLLGALETRVDALATQAGRADSIAQAAKRCDTLGTRVTVDGRTGVAIAIADDGALVLRGDDGRETSVRSGEIDATTGGASS